MLRRRADEQPPQVWQPLSARGQTAQRQPASQQVGRPLSHLRARVAALRGEGHQVGGVARRLGQAADEVLALLGHHVLLQLALQIHGIRPGPLRLHQRDVQVPAGGARGEERRR